MRSKVVFVALAMALTTVFIPLSSSHTGNITINFVGDIHGESAIRREAIPALKKYFADGNLNIFNLETAVTDHDKKEEKEYNFKTNLAFLKTLRSVRFNLATVANNHSYDFGAEGFLDTVQALDKAGIRYVGGGVNSDIAYQGQIFKVRGLRIGVLGIAKVNGGPASIAGKEKPGTTNGYDAASTESAISAMKKVSDIVIILVHWGEEGSFCPRPAEISSARKWQSLGADIILGAIHTPCSQLLLKITSLSPTPWAISSSTLQS
jgi:poly-gamma-glutamate capsule biosynthesis protein CapA/YwtB (metallophosphatase superfamily)